MKPTATFTSTADQSTERHLSGVSLLCIFFLTVSLCFQFQIIAAQVTSGNIGFETGTFAGWNGMAGQCCPVNVHSSGILVNRHTITTGNATDPYSGGQIPVRYPGSIYSVKLGNDSISAEAEMLESEFIIPSDSLLLVIRYATVIENGLHPGNKQSRFSYDISTSGNQPEGCLFKEVLAGDSHPDMFYNGAIELIPWQTSVINLTGLTGDTLTMRFITGDCSQGGHFGYAYIDCELVSASITVSDCRTDGSIMLTASANLNATWHNGTVADSITIYNPLITGNYYAEFNTGSDCYFRIPVHPELTLPNAAFIYSEDCEATFSFTNYSVASSGATFTWQFGDNTGSFIPDPIHSYSAPGIYNVILLVDQPNNCKSHASEQITITENTPVAITQSDSCILNRILFSCVLSDPGAVVTYNWFLNGNIISSLAEAEYLFPLSGDYELLLIINYSNGCTDSISKMIMLYDGPDCEFTEEYVFIPNAFSPNNDGINDIFEITGTNNKLPFEIYNRYGELIFSGDRWDGKSNGAICMSGVYCYRYKVTVNEKPVSGTGTITLLR